MNPQRIYKNSPHDLCVIRDPSCYLTKRYSRDPTTGTIALKSYGNSTYSKPELVSFTNIRELSQILCGLAADPHAAVIRCNPKREHYKHGLPIVRRYASEPKTYEIVERSWIVLDLDKLALPGGYRLRDHPAEIAGWLVQQLALFLPGFAGTSCYLKFSSSAGMQYVPGWETFGQIGPETIGAHVWAVLDRPYSNAELVRWCEAANVAWGGKLIDASTISRPGQPIYTADPIFEGVVSPISQRAFFVPGGRDTVTPIIPTAPELAERARIAGVIPQGIGYAAALDLIGDYIFPGKQGFQEPVLAACRAAVTEHGADIDPGAVLASVRERVLMFQGNRPDSEIERYSSEAFIGGKLRWYLDRQAVAEAEADARASRAAPASRSFQTLEDGQRELTEAMRGAVQKCITYHRSRELFAQYREAGLSAADARIEAKRTLGLRRWPKRPLIVVNATLGLGKTRAALEVLRAVLSGVSVDWYAPSYNLLAPTVDAYAALGSATPHRIIRGRGQPDPDQRLAMAASDRMCAHWRAAEAIACAGRSVTQALCDPDPARPACRLRNVCGYFRQFEAETPHVNFMPHAYLGTNRPRDLPEAAFAIIDENPASIAFGDIEISTGFFDNRNMRVLMLLGGFATPEQHAAVWSAVRCLWGLLWGSERSADAPIDDVLLALDFVRSRGNGVVSTQDGDALITAEMKRDIPTDRYALNQLLEQLVRCHRNGVEFRQTIQMAADDRSLRMAKFDWLKISDRKPVIILDATADFHQGAALFGQEPEWIDIQVKQNIRVTQITDLSGSKTSLYGYSALTPKARLTANDIAIRTDRLHTFAERIIERANGRRSLLITHKETREYLNGMLPDNFAIRHFGDLRGHNDHEGVEFVCVFGRQLAPLHDLERSRLAMMAVTGNDPFRPYISTNDFAERLADDAKRMNGYFVGETNGEIFHPDPIIDAMMNESCVNEIIQGVGRSRAVRSVKTIDVLLMTNIPVPGLAPDVTVTLLNFLRPSKRTKIQDYVARELPGEGTAVEVAVLASEVMARVAPDIFGSVDSATMARKRMPAELDKAFLDECVFHNVKGSRRLIKDQGKSSACVDTILDVATLLHYGKFLGTGTVRPLGSPRHSKFVASLPSNDVSKIPGILTAKFMKPIIDWTFKLFA